MTDTGRRGPALAGAAVTLLLQFGLAAPASANDCVAYLKNPKGKPPRATLEDCARTPGAQALFTALASIFAGTAIASALGQAMRHAARVGVGQAAQQAGGPRREKATRILSGRDAIEWLAREDKGFVKDGLPTEKFDQWQRRSPADETPDKDGLGAVAGEWDWGEKWGPKGQRIDMGHTDPETRKWVEPEITIVVDDDGEPPPPEKEEPPPPPPPPDKKEPPPRKEPPPEKEPPPWRPPPEEAPPPPEEVCKDLLVDVERLDTMIEKMAQANLELRREVNVLNRQKLIEKECTCVCAAVDMFNWAIAESLAPTAPLTGVLLSGIQAEVAAGIKAAIKLYFEQEVAGSDFTIAGVKAAVSKGLSEGLKILAKKWPDLLRSARMEVPNAPGGPFESFLKGAGSFGRCLLNPGFITYAFTKSWDRITEMNKLIEHKQALITQNNDWLLDKWDQLKAAQKKYGDCADRAADALRRFAQRQKETEAWAAQQKQAARDRNRRAF